MGVRRVAILGSTGSVGRQALEVIEALPDRLQVAALAAERNVEALAEQALRHHPQLVAIGDASRRGELAGRLRGSGIRVAAGPEGVREAAALDEADTVLGAISGLAGLEPVLAAVRAGKRVALANKEPLVAAGAIVTEEARRCGARILPVDSEHSAIFQALQGHDAGHVRRLILTASGGAFRDRPLRELGEVTLQEALAHPTWAMGPKVTVDSATLMNKGLEIIEAHWLFGVAHDRIDVLIHRESIVHSLVEFVDGTALAQLGAPDMRLPIQYALCYPDRPPKAWGTVDLAALGSLTFAEPDLERFPCLGLARRAAEAGGTMPAVLNGANEEAVGLFLAGRIGFMDIPALIERALAAHGRVAEPNLEQVLAADAEGRAAVRAAA
jgi:1-deoxy-D-xylulose-5-phosphate reductoisomerase